MKKASVLLVAVLALALLASCCPRVCEEPIVVEPPPPPPEPPPPPPPEPEVVEVKEMVLEPIFFDFDKYDLRPGDKEILDRNAQELRKNPQAKIRIEGNCDERGSVKYNRGLGTRRAEAARDYLAKLGIPADQFSVVSHGKEKPKYPGKTKEIFAKNRRVDFVIEFQ